MLTISHIQMPASTEQLEKWRAWGIKIGAEAILINRGNPRFYKKWVMASSEDGTGQEAKANAIILQWNGLIASSADHLKVSQVSIEKWVMRWN